MSEQAAAGAEADEGVPDEAGTDRGEMSTGRLETFSDGVFAIAATLLVLDLATPTDTPGHATVMHQLFTGHELSEYAAYAVSFLVIGITWLNHHSLFSQVKRVDRRLTILNLLLLMFLSFTPFSTRVLAKFLTEGGADAHAAAFFYSLNITLSAVTYAAIWWHVSADNGALAKQPMGDATVRKTRIQFGIGNVPYVLTLALSFVSAPITLGIHAAVAIYYALDPLRK
jgi:uncharacterized membrane protein